MVDAAMGMVSAFMDLIPYLIQLGADVLAGLSYVAGGAVSARTISEWCTVKELQADLRCRSSQHISRNLSSALALEASTALS